MYTHFGCKDYRLCSLREFETEHGVEIGGPNDISDGGPATYAMSKITCPTCLVEIEEMVHYHYDRLADQYTESIQS